MRAAANKHALQMGTVVHPAGAAIMSGPGIEALYQVVDVEGHKIAEKIGCDKIGHFAQGRRWFKTIVDVLRMPISPASLRFSLRLAVIATKGSCIAIAEVKQLGLQTWGRIKVRKRKEMGAGPSSGCIGPRAVK